MKYILSGVIYFAIMYLISSLDIENESIIVIRTFSTIVYLYLLIHNIALDISKKAINDIEVIEPEIVDTDEKLSRNGA